MKSLQLLKLLKENEGKLDIIDKITEYHPGMGTELGWSWYNGGMSDDGAWKLEVLLKVPLEQLQDQLTKWDIDAYNAKIAREQDEAKRKQYEDEGRLDEYYREIRAKEVQAWNDLKDKFERKLLWGK